MEYTLRQQIGCAVHIRAKLYISLYGVYPEAADRMCCTHQSNSICRYMEYTLRQQIGCAVHIGAILYIPIMEYTLRQQRGCAIHIGTIIYIPVWSISRGGKMIQSVYSDLYKPCSSMTNDSLSFES